MTDQEKGFVVKDRRMFSPDGEDAAKKEPAEAAETREEKAESTGPAGPAGTRDSRPPMPEINFATFIASLNASALFHLGVMEDPVSGKREKDLAMAKQTIDILSILQQKTAGNLAADEEAMLKSILYDLRILYVKERG
jgi:hypothetical protein